MPASGEPADLSAAEYSALRAAIATRGHVRIGLVLAGVVAWALVLLAVLVAAPVPLLALVPLVVIVATFETARALHVGVERIGRYLAVFHEESGESDDRRSPVDVSAPPAWEHAIVRLGPGPAGTGGHPLFAPLLGLATVVNLAAVLLPGPLTVEWVPLVAAHALFLGWMAYVNRGIRAQRAHDEQGFRGIRGRRTEAGE